MHMAPPQPPNSGRLLVRVCAERTGKCSFIVPAPAWCGSGGGQSRGFLLAGSGEGGERGCRPPVSLGLAVPAQGNSLVAEESCLTEGLGLGKLLKGKLSHCRPFSGPCLIFFFFF